jgi:hypothetical protein
MRPLQGRAAYFALSRYLTANQNLSNLRIIKSSRFRARLYASLALITLCLPPCVSDLLVGNARCYCSGFLFQLFVEAFQKERLSFNLVVGF